MKNSILILFVVINLMSCVIIRFPQNVDIEISVPDDFDKRKIEILVDTLVSKNKNLKKLKKILIIKGKDTIVNQ